MSEKSANYLTRFFRHLKPGVYVSPALLGIYCREGRSEVHVFNISVLRVSPSQIQTLLLGKSNQNFEIIELIRNAGKQRRKRQNLKP